MSIKLLVVLFTIIFINSVMGSFLIDPFLLLGSGILIFYLARKFASEKYNEKKLLIYFYLLIIITFYSISISLYFNLSWINWLLVLCIPISPVNPPHSGFDWMINSGVLNLKYLSPAEAPIRLHIIAVILFLLYPVWLFLGVKLGNRLKDYKIRKLED